MFSYVPQGNYLFSGTIRENILMINPNASDEEVSQALKLSEIEDFIENLPDGLDTVIGEKRSWNLRRSGTASCNCKSVNKQCSNNPS